MKARKSILLILAATSLFVTACADRPPAEESCNFVQNSFGRRVSWARAPIRFYVDERAMTPQHILGIKNAMAAWNQSMGRTVFELICSTNDPDDLACTTNQLPTPQFIDEERQKVASDGFNGIYFMDGDTFEKTGSRDEQARTSISFRGDFIYEADILLDITEDFYFDSEQQSQSSQQRLSFESLMIHELGHALGLDHIDEVPGSVMNSLLQKGQNRIVISEVDFNSLACEY